MAQFAISAALNIAVGLLLNYLFPPPDIRQEGPRLGDLSVQSSSYGAAIPIVYGTDRIAGNIVWSSGLEEVVNTQSYGGKGGGPSVTSTTYTYFSSFAVLLGEGPAEGVTRIWGDGKLLYDVTGGSETVGDVKFRFYPGDEMQLPDPLIEADKGVGNVSAHRGDCYIVFERLALADFGNRIPNITVELTFNQNSALPYVALTEKGTMDIPGSTSGSDDNSYIVLDPHSDDVYMIKAAANGLTRTSLLDMQTQVVRSGSLGLSGKSVRYAPNGKIYAQIGTSNFEYFYEIDPVGMNLTGVFFGTEATLGTWGDPFEFPNGCEIGVCMVGSPEIGLEDKPMFVISNNVATADPGGFVVLYNDATGALVQQNHLYTDIGRGGRVIQDFVNKRIFVTQENDTTVDLYEVRSELNVSILTGIPFYYMSSPEVVLIGSYTKGGVDYVGTADTEGWLVESDSNELVLSNGVSMFKVDLDTGNVVERNLTLGFKSIDQWTTNGKFAFGNGHTGVGDGGILYIIDTSTLSVLSTIDVGDITGLPDSLESNYQRSAYDPRSHSLIFSRQNGSTPASQRVIRLKLDRADGQGIGLDVIVGDLCDRAGLSVSEYDVTGLVGETVLGFRIARQDTIRNALQPLMQAFLFEGVESDFKMKFVRRGGSSVLTLDPDYFGKSTDDQNEFVTETRVQEVELPMNLSVRYSDKALDYQIGTQSDRRIQNPAPTMYSGEESSIDLPMVLTSTAARQIAQRVLYTVWSERSGLSSVIPWKYLRIDPTDIVTLTYRGEVLTLRIGKFEIGADLSISTSTTLEDSRSDDSAIDGVVGIGTPSQNVRSGFPTKFLQIDIPLLQASDASLQTFNRAYFALAGYDSSWPGATLFESRDSGQTYQPVGASNVEAAWGTTKAAISVPGTIYTWDESSTIDVVVVRGLSRFVSSTDAEVLNGANMIAVDGPNGPELIQFVTVTPVDSNTVRLSRLLRGRRGTDVPELTDAHVTGEQVVLLEAGRLHSFQNPLELINVAAAFRAVTAGTQIEDARVQNIAYTGQDLIPYSPVQITSNLLNPRTGDATIAWVRRTRFNGELKDFTGEVPLNEQSEKYEADYYYGGVVAIAHTNLTSPNDTVLETEWTSVTIPEGGGNRVTGEVFLRNRGFDETQGVTAPPNGWTAVTGTTLHVGAIVGTDHGTISPQSGSGFAAMLTPSEVSAEIRQDVILENLGYDGETLDLNLPTATLSVYCVAWRDAHNDLCRIILEFRDESGSFISSLDSSDFTPSPKGSWEDHFVSGAIPSGTRRLRVRLIGTRAGVGIDSPEVGFDTVRLQLGTGVPPLTAKIYQISGIMGRGRAGTAVV